MTDVFNIMKSVIQDSDSALFHFYIPLEKHTVKKNNRPIYRGRNGMPFIGKSDLLQSAEGHLTNQLRLELLRLRTFKTIDRPVWCIYWFFFPENDFVVKKGPRKGKLSGRIPDLSNLLELPSDCLQKAGVIQNDNLICSFDLSRRLPGPQCALEIFIFDYPIESPKPVLEIVK